MKVAPLSDEYAIIGINEKKNKSKELLKKNQRRLLR